MKAISLALSILTLFSTVPAFSLDLSVPAKEYYITAGDVISINVQPADEFSREVTVQPDGTIEVPLLGPIKAAGMMPSDLEKILTAKFAKYVSNPTIKISVRQFSSNRVAIIGQSLGSGYYEYREGMRLLDLVAQAGGTSDYAHASKIRIYRKQVGEDGKITEIVVPADLAAVYSGKMDKNILLASGDIVYVPRTRFSAATKWIGESFMPWATLLTFLVTASIISKKN